MINSLSLGDLANSLMLQQLESALKTEMSRLTQELTSGQTSDVKGVLAGNYSYLAGIETGLSTLKAHKVATTEASQFTNSMQLVLGTVHDQAMGFATDLITVASGGLDSVAVQTGNEALEVLKSTIGAFNTSIAGRSLFAGAATDKLPLGDAEDVIAELRTVLAGVTGASSKLLAIDNWFSDPAGFEATIYHGSNSGVAPFDLSASEALTVDIKATDEGIRDTLKNLAIAAIASDDIVDVDAAEREVLLRTAGERLLTNQDDLTAIRAKVGYAEARIESIATRNASESVSLEYAKGSLLEADPYETAMRLEEVQFQLQSLYTVTAKTSKLSLVNFL